MKKRLMVLVLVTTMLMARRFICLFIERIRQRHERHIKSCTGKNSAKKSLIRKEKGRIK